MNNTNTLPIEALRIIGNAVTALETLHADLDKTMWNAEDTAIAMKAMHHKYAIDRSGLLDAMHSLLEKYSK